MAQKGGVGTRCTRWRCGPKIEVKAKLEEKAQDAGKAGNKGEGGEMEVQAERRRCRHRLEGKAQYGGKGREI